MAASSHNTTNAAEIDRLALALAKEPGSKAFIPLAEEYGKAGMWQEAAAVLEDGLKVYPSFITAMVALGRTYDQLNQPVKAKAILEEAVKVSPENLRAHRTLAKIYVAEGAKEAALRSCNVILSVNPQDQEALSLRTILEASSTPAATEPSKPLPSTAPQESTASTIREDAIQSDSARPAIAGLAEEQKQVTPSLYGREDISQQTTAAPRDHQQATVARLEQWLASVQARRRDRERPRDSATPTS